MMTQKGKEYIKRFSTLWGVSLLSWILSQLNILCTSLVMQYNIANYGVEACLVLVRDKQ